MKDIWKYIKEYPYWERFKRETWYYFHPVSHLKDAKLYFKTENLEDLDKSYNDYKAQKRKKNEKTI